MNWVAEIGASTHQSALQKLSRAVPPVSRTPEDAAQIAKLAKSGQKMIVVGGSFIGMEAPAETKENPTWRGSSRVESNHPLVCGGHLGGSNPM